MLVRIAVLSVLSLSLANCGKLKLKEDYVGTPDEVVYDVSGAEGQDKNPIGSLIFESSRTTINFCTAFVISEYRILTNQHCIYNENKEVLASADQLFVLFRNYGHDQKKIRISKIIHAERQKETYNRYFSLYDERQDWALLESEESLEEFGALELGTELPSITYFQNKKLYAAGLTMPKVNPPEEDNAPYTTKFIKQNFVFNVSEYFSEEKLKEETDDMQLMCRVRNEKDCELLKYTASDVYKKLEKVHTVPITTKIRKGNSGSPLLIDGKVVGIAHSGLFAKGSKAVDTEEAFGQLLHNSISKINK